jgi:hypothetical protein
MRGGRNAKLNIRYDLPSVTIVIEWENAIDTEDKWAQRAVTALQEELEAVALRMAEKPAVTYLYDETLVDPRMIWRVIDAAAPRLAAVAAVEVLPTPGLSYYDLKNFGVSRAKTALSVILDSDAAPQAGWLESMVTPFADPAVMAVGGITVLAFDDLFSKTLALTWIFGLAEEREATAKAHGIYANNTAVRTAFFRDYPFPPLKAFKKQCVFWLARITAEGHRYVRVPDAVTIHAPHPGYRFMFWRAWMTGLDRDFKGFHTKALSRIGRIAYAFGAFAKRLARAWFRIMRKRKSVDLPLWQIPGAMGITLGFFVVTFAAQLFSAVSRSHEDLPCGYERRLSHRG